MLDASANNFTGALPALPEIAMSSLLHLNLSGNALRGTLPASWALMTSLRTLDLSFNTFQVRCVGGRVPGNACTAAACSPASVCS